MSDLFDYTPPAPKLGMGGHQSAAAMSTTWLTPPHVIDGLGGADSFDLDPCGFPGWRTAKHAICLPDDGLAADWGDDNVWMNSPYGAEGETWLQRLADHGRGVALIFARTETASFHRDVWGRAAGLLFLAGRLHFHYPDGENVAACDGHHVWKERAPKVFSCRLCGVSKTNAGAPSVLCAYGQDDLDRLAACVLPGALTPLRFPRGVMGVALDLTWTEAVAAWIRRQDGPVALADLYRAFRRHPKAKANPNYRAKIRQTLKRGGFARVGPGVYAGALA